MITPSATSPAPYILVSRWRRFACMMYEGVLLFGVVFLAGYLFDTLTQSTNALYLRHTRQAVLFLAIGIYFVICWWRRGQTLPMKTWQLRLVGVDGSRPNLGTLILRYVLAWVLPLIAALAVMGLARSTGYASTDLLIVFAPFAHFVWSWFDKEGLFFHDRLARTRLVAAPLAPARTRTAG